MYNYVPALSPKNGDTSEEDISGFGSHSRYSYSLSSLNNSHNNSHNSLHSLCSQTGIVSDKGSDADVLLRAKDKVGAVLEIIVTAMYTADNHSLHPCPIVPLSHALPHPPSSSFSP